MNSFENKKIPVVEEEQRGAFLEKGEENSMEEVHEITEIRPNIPGDNENKERAQEIVDRIRSLDIPNSRPDFENAERVERYKEKYIPEHIQGKPPLLYTIYKKLGGMFVREVRGKENVPEEAALFISTHRGGESGRLMAALDRPVHIAAAEVINWKDTVKAFFMRKLQMIPVRETFSQLTRDQQKRVVDHIPNIFSGLKKRHKEAMQVKASLGGGNIRNIKTMAALLLDGRDVAIFSEGPFSFLKEDDRQSYAGFSLVAREYKRMTGKNIPVVPVGIRNSRVAFGESFTIDQEKKMTHEELQEIATQRLHNLYDSLEE